MFWKSAISVKAREKPDSVLYGRLLAMCLSGFGLSHWAKENSCELILEALVPVKAKKFKICLPFSQSEFCARAVKEDRYQFSLAPVLQNH